MFISKYIFINFIETQEKIHNEWIGVPQLSPASESLVNATKKPRHLMENISIINPLLESKMLTELENKINRRIKRYTFLSNYFHN